MSGRMRPAGGGRIPAILSGVAVVAALGVAAPANAATVGPLTCVSGGYASGSTEAYGQLTFDSASYAHCGTLGIRVYYTHVGGASWTSWKYSAWGGGAVSHNVGNGAYKSQHTTSIGSLRWESFR